MQVPSIPWQLTGNHWLALPCIHPADGAIHALGVVHRGARAVIELAGGQDFSSGGATPLLRPELRLNGEVRALATEGIAWERDLGWLPTFTCTVGTLVVRGTIFAPYGRDSDMSGAVYSFTVENRGKDLARVDISLRGCLGYRSRRVRTARGFDDLNSVAVGPDDTILLEGSGVPGLVAAALGSDGPVQIEADVESSADPRHFSMMRTMDVAAGTASHAAFYLAVGPERDGAQATVAVLRRWGARALLAATREALASLEKHTGDDGIDHLVNRNLFFAYFCAVGRALDDAQFYLMRTRIPWHTAGCTIRDWEALMWTLPAVQMADPGLARELLMRICELHGYAPGQGVHYFDGTLFQPGFALEGPAAFAIAIDRYIAETGDVEIMEEPVISDTLYLAHDDLESRRDERVPLYSTEVLPSGRVPAFPFTLHGNSAASLALEIFGRLFDEDSPVEVADPEDVREAIHAHFVTGRAEQSYYATAVDLAGGASKDDDPVGTALWVPEYRVVEGGDRRFRRTVKLLSEKQSARAALLPRLALLQLSASQKSARSSDMPDVLSWLRRAVLDNGLAGEQVDSNGHVVYNGGDAALSGLLAWTVFRAVAESTL